VVFRSAKERAFAERKTTIRWLLVSASVLIAIMLAAVWPPKKPIVNEPSQSTTEPSTLDPLLEWNATQSELDDTARTIEQLDADAKRDLE
ncbi:MAG: hypothetical protein O3A00_26725, partial [Planctomycetota bacterium]|nr:hypothetical protein [Planctomycetota bacterium]